MDYKIFLFLLFFLSWRLEAKEIDVDVNTLRKPGYFAYRMELEKAKQEKIDIEIQKAKYARKGTDVMGFQAPKASEPAPEPKKFKSKEPAKPVACIDDRYSLLVASNQQTDDCSLAVSKHGCNGLALDGSGKKLREICCKTCEAPPPVNEHQLPWIDKKNIDYKSPDGNENPKRKTVIQMMVRTVVPKFVADAIFGPARDEYGNLIFKDDGVELRPSNFYRRTIIHDPKSKGHMLGYPDASYWEEKKNNCFIAAVKDSEANNFVYCGVSFNFADGSCRAFSNKDACNAELTMQEHINDKAKFGKLQKNGYATYIIPTVGDITSFFAKAPEGEEEEAAGQDYYVFPKTMCDEAIASENKYGGNCHNYGCLEDRIINVQDCESGCRAKMCTHFQFRENAGQCYYLDGCRKWKRNNNFIRYTHKNAWSVTKDKFCADGLPNVDTWGANQYQKKSWNCNKRFGCFFILEQDLPTAPATINDCIHLCRERWNSLSEYDDCKFIYLGQISRKYIYPNSANLTQAVTVCKIQKVCFTEVEGIPEASWFTWYKHSPPGGYLTPKDMSKSPDIIRLDDTLPPFEDPSQCDIGVKKFEEQCILSNQVKKVFYPVEHGHKPRWYCCFGSEALKSQAAFRPKGAVARLWNVWKMVKQTGAFYNSNHMWKSTVNRKCCGGAWPNSISTDGLYCTVDGCPSNAHGVENCIAACTYREWCTGVSVIQKVGKQCMLYNRCDMPCYDPQHDFYHRPGFEHDLVPFECDDSMHDCKTPYLPRSINKELKCCKPHYDENVIETQKSAGFYPVSQALLTWVEKNSFKWEIYDATGKFNHKICAQFVRHECEHQGFNCEGVAGNFCKSLNGEQGVPTAQVEFMIQHCVQDFVKKDNSNAVACTVKQHAAKLEALLAANNAFIDEEKDGVTNDPEAQNIYGDLSIDEDKQNMVFFYNGETWGPICVHYKHFQKNGDAYHAAQLLCDDIGRDNNIKVLGVQLLEQKHYYSVASVKMRKCEKTAKNFGQCELEDIKSNQRFKKCQHGGFLSVSCKVRETCICTDNTSPCYVPPFGKPLNLFGKLYTGDNCALNKPDKSIGVNKPDGTWVCPTQIDVETRIVQQYDLCRSCSCDDIYEQVLTYNDDPQDPKTGEQLILKGAITEDADGSNPTWSGELCEIDLSNGQPTKCKKIKSIMYTKCWDRLDSPFEENVFEWGIDTIGFYPDTLIPGSTYDIGLLNEPERDPMPKFCGDPTVIDRTTCLNIKCHEEEHGVCDHARCIWVDNKCKAPGFKIYIEGINDYDTWDDNCFTFRNADFGVFWEKYKIATTVGKRSVVNRKKPFDDSAFGKFLPTFGKCVDMNIWRGSGKKSPTYLGSLFLGYKIEKKLSKCAETCWKMDVSPTVNGATNFGAKCFGFTAEYGPPRVNWGDPKNLRDKAQIRLKSHFDEIPIFEYNWREPPCKGRLPNLNGWDKSCASKPLETGIIYQQLDSCNLKCMTTNDCTFAGCETLVTVEQCASTCGITSGIDSCNYFAWKASGRGGKGSPLGWCQPFRGAKFLKLDPDFDVHTDKNYGIYRRTNSWCNADAFIEIKRRTVSYLQLTREERADIFVTYNPISRATQKEQCRQRCCDNDECVSYVFNNQYFAEECLQFKVRLFHYRPELLKGLPKPPVLNRFMTQNYYEKLPNGDWDSFIDRKVVGNVWCEFFGYVGGSSLGRTGEFYDKFNCLKDLYERRAPKHSF